MTTEDQVGGVEPPDLAAVKHQVKLMQLGEKMHQRLFDSEYKQLERDLDCLAKALSEARAPMTEGLQFRARRILLNRVGRNAAFLILWMGAPSSYSQWNLDCHLRKPSETPDLGRRRARFHNEVLQDAVVTSVYLKMKHGMGRADAIDGVKAVFLSHNPPTHLPSPDTILKWMNSYRARARRRGYTELPSVHPRESLGRIPRPRLLLSDFPKRGRPKNK